MLKKSIKKFFASEMILFGRALNTLNKNLGSSTETTPAKVDEEAIALSRIQHK